ncbi:MAG: hypothetical protein JJT89_04190, partial [Nitriliruptoraceae bacterium]|nr:hypothetical protein [Nitriliruptoraceae bacterium]
RASSMTPHNHRQPNSGQSRLLLGLPDGLVGDTVPAREGLWALIAGGGVLAGVAVGTGWAAVREAGRQTVSDGPRLARPTASRASDYVAPLELWAARAAAISPALALAVGLVLATGVDTVAPADLVNVGTVLAVVVGLGVLAMGEVIARRLLELRQSAGSTLELAWSDALRSRVLRDVVAAPMVIGLLATLALLTAASGGVNDPVIANGLIGLVGLGFIGVAVIALVGASSRPQRHFRRRLWPRAGADYPGAGLDVRPSEVS